MCQVKVSVLLRWLHRVIIYCVTHASVIFLKLVLHSFLYPVQSNLSNVINNDEIAFYNHLCHKTIGSHLKTAMFYLKTVMVKFVSFQEEDKKKHTFNIVSRKLSLCVIEITSITSETSCD